jgi:hypothetical protein
MPRAEPLRVWAKAPTGLAIEQRKHLSFQALFAQGHAGKVRKIDRRVGGFRYRSQWRRGYPLARFYVSFDHVAPSTCGYFDPVETEIARPGPKSG